MFFECLLCMFYGFHPHGCHLQLSFKSSFIPFSSHDDNLILNTSDEQEISGMHLSKETVWKNNCLTDFYLKTLLIPSKFQQLSQSKFDE